MSYMALFLTQDLIVIGNKKFKPTDVFINFKKGTFNIRLDAYLYRTKDTTIYGYIYPTDERILIDVKTKEPAKQEPIKQGETDYKIDSARLVKLKEKMEHGDLHLLVGESIIGQLARALVAVVKTNWILIILAIGFGIAVGYIACTVINPHTITTITNSTITNGTALTSPIPTV